MNIIGVGCNTIHRGEFSINRPNGYGAYLLLHIRTKAFSRVGDTYSEVPEDTIILYDPHTGHTYGTVGELYVDDWIHFAVNKREEAWIREQDIPLNQPIDARGRKEIETLIQNINLEFYSANEMRQQTQQLYLRILLLKLHEISRDHKKETSDQIRTGLSKLRSQIYNMPAEQWNVEEMARKQNLSVSHFQHSYKKLFGVSVMQDVLESRITQGKLLLAGTDLSVKKIASQCGYEYEVYFMRQFKKRTGETALQYRKRERKQTERIAKKQDL